MWDQHKNYRAHIHHKEETGQKIQWCGLLDNGGGPREIRDIRNKASHTSCSKMLLTHVFLRSRMANYQRKKRKLGHTHKFRAFNCSNKDTVVLKQFKTIHLLVWSSPLFSFEKHNRLWPCSRVIIGLFSWGLLTARQVLDCEVQWWMVMLCHFNAHQGPLANPCWVSLCIS